MTQQAFFPDDYLDELIDVWDRDLADESLTDFIRRTLGWSEREVTAWLSTDQLPRWWYNNYWLMGGPR